ncbi:hypothetical protein F5144DRAFT_589962 [Chaetomium tenue]|uniref:Uncharacterized protein n=1 Tax=Chaetomium tenue TaxID=1854479 RepID=A0ACB7PHL9_9PEZI|nr:hypothetical protein F5144DRAFT_589962 [Chaetomium globosum]
MKRFTSIRRDKRKSADMASPQVSAAPSRQTTMASIASDEAVPETDPNTTAGLLTERLQAWKHAVVYLEEYMEAVEKIHKAQAKEYERVLKVHSALINTNLETEKNIKGSALPIVERLHKEIKHKAKELAHGAEKSAKEVEKARNTTQKHIELLGQHTASFEATGGKHNPSEDPYTNFEAFERHIIQVLHQAMETFTGFTGGQALKVQALHQDMLGAAQSVPLDFEWKAFVKRSADKLINASDPPRTVEAIQFPNIGHPSTKPLLEGSLERKSRNKLSWGYTTGYYVITPCKFLHEFKDDDNVRRDPVPELSIYLPDAVIGAPSGDKFNVKGKDRSGGMGGRLAGTSELAFKAHSPAEAEKWFNVIRGAAGATGPASASALSSPTSPTSPAGSMSLAAASASGGSGSSEKPKPVVAVPAGSVPPSPQETGITGGETVASPVAVASPVVASGAATPVSATGASVDKKASVDVPAAAAPAAAPAEKAAVGKEEKA